MAKCLSICGNSKIALVCIALSLVEFLCLLYMLKANYKVFVWVFTYDGEGAELLLELPLLLLLAEVERMFGAVQAVPILDHELLGFVPGANVLIYA